ncbi:MAG: hypothetical protein ACT4N4_09980 [Rhodospirillales bacterium]
MRNLFSVCLWGDSYVSSFLSASLPTLLAPGNLGRIDRRRDSRFLIITTANDAARIAAAPQYRDLQRFVSTEILTIPKPSRYNKYSAVSRCQMHAIHLSRDFDSLFFLYPDFIYSDGAIGNAIRRLEQGHDAVVLPVPRIVEETLLPELAAAPRTDNGSIALAPRDFVKLTSRHLHRTTWSYLWGATDMTSYPSSLIWRMPDGGLLYRCFHIHPLAVLVQRTTSAFVARFRISVDEEYLSRVFPDIGSIYCVPDSDEAAVCSLVEGFFEVSRVPSWQKTDILYMAQWMEENASTLHRQFARHPYRWHAGDASAPDWREVEETSDMVIQRIVDRGNIPDSILRVEDRAAYSARRRRARRFRHWAWPAIVAPLRIRTVSTYGLFIAALYRICWNAVNATGSRRIVLRLLYLWRHFVPGPPVAVEHRSLMSERLRQDVRDTAPLSLISIFAEMFSRIFTRSGRQAGEKRNPNPEQIR